MVPTISAGSRMARTKMRTIFFLASIPSAKGLSELSKKYKNRLLFRLVRGQKVLHDPGLGLDTPGVEREFATVGMKA